MNTESINQLKGTYRQFLLTEKGRDMLGTAVRLQKEWNATKYKYPNAVGTAHQKTKYVKREFLPQEVQDRMTLIKITPIGLNNVCHNNAEHFSENGFESRTGYNVFACSCGKYLTLEPHSVNKKEGVLYDFTKDFDGEPEKWFLELNTRNTHRQLMKVFGNKNVYMNVGCKCNVTRNQTELKLNRKTPSELLDEIESKEQIVIWG